MSTKAYRATTPKQKSEACVQIQRLEAWTYKKQRPTEPPEAYEAAVGTETVELSECKGYGAAIDLDNRAGGVEGRPLNCKALFPVLEI